MGKFIKKFTVSAVTALLLFSPLAASYNNTLSVSAADLTLRTTFPDISNDDWFAYDVKKLVASGIVSGYPDGYFHPEREMTIAEFVKILVCTDPSLTASGAVRLFPEHWASDFITIAYENGIITDEDLISGFYPDSPITRAAMTKMMILALNIVRIGNECPFTDSTDPYAAVAYNEYLLRGYIQPDGTRICKGESLAMRSEAAAIAVRVMEYRSDPYSFKKDAVLQNATENILRTERELIDLFYVLNREFMTEFTFRTSQTTRRLREYCERSNVANLEYFYNAFTNIDQLGDGRYRVTIEYLPDIRTVKKYHSEAVLEADRIIANVISPDMTDLEKVTALHDYLVKNCEYDIDNYRSNTITQISRLAYGALIDKKAVCQGYCAAFALLCDRADIKCIVVGGNAPNSSDSHAWNVVLIDGERYHVDTTHDDPVPDRKNTASHKYLCLTENEMISYGYTWTTGSSDLKYFR